MKLRTYVIIAVAIASILFPLAIGALRGVGLSSAADGNQTFPFAESYYDEVYDYEHLKRRADFSETGYDYFGLKTQTKSECQERLYRQFVDDDMLVSAALSSQRSSVLEQIFDQPGIEAIEALSSPVVGALIGCRYTLLTAVCDAWTQPIISRATKQKMPTLENKKRQWLKQNEAASCKAADKFGGK